MTDTKTAQTIKIPVRHLQIGDKLVWYSEVVRAVRPIRGQGRNRWVSTHRELTIERADGTLRRAHWNASTEVLIYAREE